MPAQVTTQLLDDSPAVAVIGDNSLLRQGLERLFKKASFSVKTLTLEEFLEDETFSAQSWHKIVWVNTSESWENKRYLAVCAALKQLLHPIVVVLPIFSSVEGLETPEGVRWLKHSKLQTQVIIDCSFYLSTAAFLFGRDIVGGTPQKNTHCLPQSGLEHSAVFLEKKQLLQVTGDFFPQTLDQFLFALSPLVLRPFSAVSVQIKGVRTPIIQAIKQIVFEYHSYYGVTLAPVQIQLSTTQPVPFSTEQIQSPPGGAVTAFVRSLPIVTDIRTHSDSQRSTQLPEPQQNERVKLTSKESLFLEHTPSPLPKQGVFKPDEETARTGIQESTSNSRVLLEASPSIPRLSELENPKTSASTQSLTRIIKSSNPRADQASVQQDLQKIFQSSRTNTKTSHVKNLVQVHTKVSKKTKRKQTLFYLGVGVIGVGLGMLFLTSTFFVTNYLLTKVLADTVVLAAEGKSVPRERLTQLSQGVSLQVKSYSAVVQIPQLTQASQTVELSERLLKYIDSHQQLLLDQEKVINSIVGGDDLDLMLESESIATRARQAYEEISYLQGLLQSSEIFEGSTDSQQLELYEKLENERHSLLIAQQLFPIIPELFAYTGSSTYAVLFQNDQELRPTGGFLQAVGFLEFNQGVLREVSARSSYELDALVFGEVEPPQEIKQYLGEQRLYLRDSNWNPDFPASAEQARWFIEKATNQEISGLIALNTQSLALLLEAIGPLDLPEFNEVLTHRNIKERMEFHSEVILVEAGGVPDYSTLVLQRTLEKLQTLPKERLPIFVSALGRSLKQQQLLLYSTSVGMQSNWQALSWSGGMITPQCPTQLATATCVVEAIAQVEANVGVNKANYYVEREIAHSVSFLDDQTTHTREITYVNTAQSDAWPKGPYKSYVRVYLPDSARNIDVTIGGRPLAPELLSQQQENNRVIVGFYLEVPVQKSLSVVLSFATDGQKQEKFSYALFDQKQSGSTSTPYALTIQNGALQPVLIAPQADLSDGEIRFSQVQDSHLFFGVQF
jgi:hypothetical protein